MGSDCSSFHQERSHTMRWGYLALILLVTVAGVQLLEEENAESALNNLSESEGKQSLPDAILPLVKREAGKKKTEGKIVRRKKSKRVGRKKENLKAGKKRGSRKSGKKNNKQNRLGKKKKKSGRPNKGTSVGKKKRNGK